MLSEELFRRLEASADVSWRVECSLAEIYNERVRRGSCRSTAECRLVR
jgi:hypothetical protein